MLGGAGLYNLKEIKMKQRFDYIMLKAHKDEHGFLVDTPVVARVGLQEYTLPDGTIQREFRPRNEVFAWDSLESYRGKSITLGHVVVTPENAKKVTVGNCSGAAFGEEAEGKVRCPVTIMDEKAIDAAESGKAPELSVGYTVVEIHESGWGSNQSGEYIFKRDMPDDYTIPSDWVEFDVLQTQIRVNHLAMVKKGRAGVARLNLDGSEEIKYDEPVINSNEEDKPMLVKIKIDSAEVEVSKDVADHIAKQDAAIAAHPGALAKVEAERDALQVKVDGIPAEIEKAVAAEKTKADEAAAIVLIATEAGIKCDGLDSKGIKVAFIKEVLGIDAKDKSDAYVDQSFEIAKDSDKMAQNRAKVHGDSVDERNDAANDLPDPQARFRK